MYINSIWDEVVILATIATALVVCPVIFSPTTNSAVVDDGLEIVLRVAFGANGSLTFPDSKTPWSWITSGVLREIISSSTLVPTG